MDAKTEVPGGIIWKLEKVKAVSGEFLGRMVVLFKLRVVVLLVLAAIAGALLASGGHISLGRLFLLILTGTLSAASASAVNQYIERDRDGQMVRTRRRPLAMGVFSRPKTALEVSIALIVMAVLVALPFSLSLAFFLATGAIIYIWVYTIWLKPRTWLNIVIGGLAGSCAVLSGGAAVGNWAEPGVLALAFLVYLWTPTHFWSLALAYREDYARASVPMLPVIVSPRTSATWIALHTTAAIVTALLMGLHPSLGFYYLLITLPASMWLGWHSLKLVIMPDPKQALKLFKVSNIYLGLVLMAIYLVTLF